MPDTEELRQAIDTLRACSCLCSPVDAALDDQLLILTTCTEKDDQRRIVAARRIRDWEDETELKRLVESMAEQKG